MPTRPAIVGTNGATGGAPPVTAHSMRTGESSGPVAPYPPYSSRYWSHSMFRPALQPTSISCTTSPLAAYVNAGPSRALRPTSFVWTVRVLSTSRRSSVCSKQRSRKSGGAGSEERPAYTSARGCETPSRRR